MRSGASKACSQCGEIKPISNYKDRSLVTGLGRFCLECKSQPVDLKYHPVGNNGRKDPQYGLSKSDVNRLLSFSKNPEKYAIDSHAVKEKVYYLDTISYKFNTEQLAIYREAREKYASAVATKKESKIQKKDYSATLGDAFNNHKAVKIRYKGSWRTIDPYSLNKTYVVAYCHSARDIRTFRIDRIQGAELLGVFSVDESLRTAAQGKLAGAHSYTGYRRRY